MVVVDWSHSLVLGFWVTVQTSCNIVLYLSLDSSKTAVVCTIHNNKSWIFLLDLSLCIILFFWGWIFGILYLHLGELVFNAARVYVCLHYVVLNDLDEGIKLLHVVIVCCVPSLE